MEKSIYFKGDASQLLTEVGKVQSALTGLSGSFGDIAQEHRGGLLEGVIGSETSENISRVVGNLNAGQPSMQMLDSQSIAQAISEAARTAGGGFGEDDTADAIKDGFTEFLAEYKRTAGEQLDLRRSHDLRQESKTTLMVPGGGGAGGRGGAGEVSHPEGASDGSSGIPDVVGGLTTATNAALSTRSGSIAGLLQAGTTIAGIGAIAGIALGAYRLAEDAGKQYEALSNYVTLDGGSFGRGSGDQYTSLRDVMNAIDVQHYGLTPDEAYEKLTGLRKNIGYDFGALYEGQGDLNISGRIKAFKDILNVQELYGLTEGQATSVIDTQEMVKSQTGILAIADDIRKKTNLDSKGREELTDYLKTFVALANQQSKSVEKIADASSISALIGLGSAIGGSFEDVRQTERFSTMDSAIRNPSNDYIRAANYRTASRVLGTNDPLAIKRFLLDGINAPGLLQGIAEEHIGDSVYGGLNFGNRMGLNIVQGEAFLRATKKDPALLETVSRMQRGEPGAAEEFNKLWGDVSQREAPDLKDTMTDLSATTRTMYQNMASEAGEAVHSLLEDKLEQIKPYMTGEKSAAAELKAATKELGKTTNAGIAKMFTSIEKGLERALNSVLSSFGGSVDFETDENARLRKKFLSMTPEQKEAFFKRAGVHEEATGEGVTIAGFLKLEEALNRNTQAILNMNSQMGPPRPSGGTLLNYLEPKRVNTVNPGDSIVPNPFTTAK